MTNFINTLPCLSLVILAHAGAITLALSTPLQTADELTLPTIQGVFLPMPAAEVVEVPSAKASPTKPVPVEPEVEKKVVTKPNKPKPPITTPKQSSKSAIEQLEEIDYTPAKRMLPSISAKDNNSQGAPITPPKMDANPINNPAPAYPRLSRSLKEQGTVVLEILILPDGSVGEVRLKQSSGFDRLDKTAMKAIKRWRYQPARRGDQAIEYWYLQPLDFTLN